MLQVERTDRGHRLTGVIDEHADLSVLPNEALDLDLGGVERINSMGIVAWQRWRRARSAPVTLRNVPVSFVLALSCVAGLAEGMRVSSVRAPFVDPASGRTEEIVLDASALRTIRTTGDCPPRAALRLDDDPKQYFAFLTVPKGPALEGDA